MEEHKKVKQNKLKIKAILWDKKLELSDGFYSPSDTQNYFEHIIKKYYLEYIILSFPRLKQ